MISFRVGQFDYDAIPDSPDNKCVLGAHHAGPFTRVRQNGDIVCLDCATPMVITEAGMKFLEEGVRR
jgi:hypothetical protein